MRRVRRPLRPGPSTASAGCAVDARRIRALGADQIYQSSQNAPHVIRRRAEFCNAAEIRGMGFEDGKDSRGMGFGRV